MSDTGLYAISTCRMDLGKGGLSYFVATGGIAQVGSGAIDWPPRLPS